LTNLISVHEAQAQITSTFKAVSPEFIPLVSCAGRILAETITAPGDLPPFANSSMDGFAVLAGDVGQAMQAQPVTLRVVSDIPAGSAAQASLLPGQAARIMTGAPLPPGADAVVPVEDTDFGEQQHADLPEQVAIYKATQAGQNVRPRGMDIRQGQVLLKPGRKLQAQDVGLLASIGRTEVSVYRKPRVALFSSGDELVQPGKPLQPGQIYDSNQFVLAAFFESAGAEVMRLGVARDDPQDVYNLLHEVSGQQVDLIVTSAGVSVGAFDFIRHVIQNHGRLALWRVNMRPGKPLAFGSFEGVPLIGLPGNPVSAYVGAQVFVLPVLHKLAGRPQVSRQRARARLAHAIESDGRESYLRAVVKEEHGKLVATLTGHQGSGNLYSLVQANALLIVPSGVKSLPSDSEVEFWFLEND
jgi:molybdopterin molybdotransferase